MLCTCNGQYDTEALGKLGGQLTGSLFATEGDVAAHPDVVPALTRKVLSALVANFLLVSENWVPILQFWVQTHPMFNYSL